FRDLFLQSCEALRSKMLELQVKLVLFSSLGLAIRKSLTRCVQVRDTCSVEKFASFSFLFRQHGVGVDRTIGAQSQRSRSGKLKLHQIIETAFHAIFKRGTVERNPTLCAISISHAEGWQAGFLGSAQPGDLDLQCLQAVDNSGWQCQQLEIGIDLFKAGA